ncbi:hypothetical protein ACVNPS_03840 [Candidatus Bipolaricaulota sp. J31]
MEREIIFIVEESPEGGYEAHALGHAIFTEADTRHKAYHLITGKILADVPASKGYFVRR